MGSITRCSDSTRAGWSQGDCMGEARRNMRSFSVKVWSGRIEEIELEFRGSIFISFFDRNLVTASMVSAAFVHWGQSECSEHLGFHPVTWRLAAAVPVGWLVGVEVCWLRSLARLMFACFHKNVHIAEVPTSHRWSVGHGHDASLCHFFFCMVSWLEMSLQQWQEWSRASLRLKSNLKLLCKVLWFWATVFGIAHSYLSRCCWRMRPIPKLLDPYEKTTYFLADFSWCQVTSPCISFAQTWNSQVFSPLTLGSYEGLAKTCSVMFAGIHGCASDPRWTIMARQHFAMQLGLFIWTSTVGCVPFGDVWPALISFLFNKGAEKEGYMKTR